MRLLLALFIATLLTALLDYTVSQSPVDVPALIVNEQSYSKHGVELKNPSAFEMIDNPGGDQGIGLEWLWKCGSPISWRSW